MSIPSQDITSADLTHLQRKETSRTKPTPDREPIPKVRPYQYVIGPVRLPHAPAYPATLAKVTLNGQTVKLDSRIDNRAKIHDVKFCRRSLEISHRITSWPHPELTPTSISAMYPNPILPIPLEMLYKAENVAP